MKKFITIGMILMFALAVVAAEPVSEEQFVTNLQNSGVQFVYSTSKTDSAVTIIKTEDTKEVIETLLEERPVDLDITVVEYVTRGRSGYDLNYEE